MAVALAVLVDVGEGGVAMAVSSRRAVVRAVARAVAREVARVVTRAVARAVVGGSSFLTNFNKS